MDAEGLNATPGDVEAELARAFPRERWNDVRQLLEVLPVDSHRIKVAVLRLSEGDLSRLCHAIDQAIVDYRDVLAAAYYPLTTEESARAAARMIDLIDRGVVHASPEELERLKAHLKMDEPRPPS